ncbi:retrotransposon protein, putative, Ty3-gypsy subclass [Panicum miliaceum]|uniref:Retrotransposon protein, putative, Ty3-gypsy subclass n=1 Tax=Panicum miliaceum TaxID=4540 RepID=A0A3L6PF09_PANMI|nr:retrotransposon protein, putative, Ty3-gypsy subclass [Panicum miliaceum]
MITEVDDRDVIHYFHQGLHNIELWRKMFDINPKIVSEMMTVINKHADMEDAEKAHCHHKDRRNSDDRPKPSHYDRQRHEDLDRLLDGKCPWHKDANHTARECHALRNSVVADDSKRPRYDDRDKASGSKGSRSRGRQSDSPRSDHEEPVDKSLGDFQDVDRSINFIYGGSKAPRC